MSKKRPCCECHRWFLPDPRVGDRQRTCSLPCRRLLRSAQQAEWRARNAEYFAARRLDERQQQRVAGGEPAISAPAPLDQVPWDVAQTEFGPQGADFLALLARVQLRHAQSERRAQVLDSS